MENFVPIKLKQDILESKKSNPGIDFSANSKKLFEEENLTVT